MNLRLPILLPLLATLLNLVLALPAAAIDLSRKVQGADELLSADQAFRLVSATRGKDGVTISWIIEPGYYLYKQRLSVEAVSGKAKLPALQLPTGEAKHDEHFGDVEIYKSALEARLPLARDAAAPAQLKVRYQGCAEAGVCYPPVTRIIDVVAAP